MILVPVKDTSLAKQRLTEVLDASSRTALAQAMLQDVLETLVSWRSHTSQDGEGDVALVTSDSFAVALAEKLGFEVIPDSANSSETDAIEMATRVCVARGVKQTLVVPADIPLIAEWELNEIFSAAPSEGAVLVPAADGRGTNAALRSPAALFPLRFGNDSFRPHLASAQVTGKPCVVLSLPGIALDVDRPDDLQELLFAPGNGRAQTLVRQWDITRYPMAANE